MTRMIGAIMGPPIARWSPRPSPPTALMPEAYGLGDGITLWRLPVGVVRIREWHCALPPELAEVDDMLRFPMMMADRRITGRLDCMVWLIDHPEQRILVDAGKTAAFCTPNYLGDLPRDQAWTSPKVIDATAPESNDLPTMLAAAGVIPRDIDLCVLIHTNSDHIGNLGRLDRSTRLLVPPEELVPAGRGGRLMAKLPQDGRVHQT